MTHIDPSAERSKVRIASSKMRVKSNVRRHPSTTGPKTNSLSNPQLDAMM
jgi:hypothetical protein